MTADPNCEACGGIGRVKLLVSDEPCKCVTECCPPPEMSVLPEVMQTPPAIEDRYFGGPL